DANHNSAYPYVVGPNFYGNVVVSTVTTVPTGTTTYVLANDSFNLNNAKFTLYPNPASDFIAIQTDLVESNLKVEIFNELGQIVKTTTILQGSTLSIIETDTFYNGIYFVKISDGKITKSHKVIINK
ncbi:MAG: hypothetical protein ACI9FW_001266, partial [Flavobacterium sp.]